MKKLNKSISLILIIAMLISSLSSASMYSTSSINDTKVSGETVRKLITEDISQRDKFTRTYLYDDGTRTVVMSAKALNYKINGKWEDIDNTLVSATDEKGAQIYQNDKNSYKVKMPKELTQGMPITIEKDGYILSFLSEDSIKKSTAIKGSIIADTNEKSDAKKQAKFETKISDITYADIDTNTDIKYYVEPDELKEEIILKNKPENALSYTYRMQTNGLVAKLQGDNSIELFNNPEFKGEPIFIMPAPIMYDALNASSSDIKINIVKENGEYKLTYIPLASWISDSERQYPVIIDPTVQTERNTTSVDDTYTTFGSINNGTSNVLWCGNSGGSNCKAYLKFNTLPSTNPGDIVTNAKVYLYSTSQFTSNEIDVHLVTSNWIETGLTAMNSPYNSAEITDYIYAAETGYVSWDVTNIAQYWYLMGTNNGMVFKMNPQTDEKKIFASSETADSNMIPYIEIIYKNANGTKNISSQRSISVGRAGDVYFNDYTGNLSVVRSDIGFTGNIMPVNISMIYNTANKDQNITNCSGGFDKYGAGWKTNYNQTIKYYAIGANNNTKAYYTYTTDDGSIIYFENDSEAIHPTAAFVDNNGSGYRLSINPADPSDYTEVTVITPSKQTLSFDNPSSGDIGRLVKITGNNQTLRHVTPASGDNYYEYISGDGQVIFFDKVTSDPAPTDPGLMYVDPDFSANGYSITVTPGSLDDMTMTTVKKVDTNQIMTFTSSGEIDTVNNDEINVQDINIAYETSETASCAIDNITDGVNRTYQFVYDATTKRLNSIDYKGSGSTTLKSVLFSNYIDGFFASHYQNKQHKPEVAQQPLNNF